jgi:hypothetical protein
LYPFATAELDRNGVQSPLQTAQLNAIAPLLLPITKQHSPAISTEKAMETNIRSLVEGFVGQIVAAVEADSVRRVQQAVTAALTDGAATAPRRSGRPVVTGAQVVSAPVRRRAKQFCPVPNCTGVAAPVFGMVCAKHKDMPQAKIDEYRAQRRATKSGKK